MKTTRRDGPIRTCMAGRPCAFRADVVRPCSGSAQRSRARRDPWPPWTEQNSDHSPKRSRSLPSAAVCNLASNKMASLQRPLARRNASLSHNRPTFLARPRTRPTQAISHGAHGPMHQIPSAMMKPSDPRSPNEFGIALGTRSGGVGGPDSHQRRSAGQPSSAIPRTGKWSSAWCFISW